LTQSAIALAGLTSGVGHRAFGMARLPIRSQQPVASFFPELIAADTLQALATTGVDAARQAGAEYADIRLTDLRLLRLGIELGDSGVPTIVGNIPGAAITFELSYGIRARVGGAWAFVTGNECTSDAVAAAGRRAAATARGVAASVRQPWEMVAAPAVRGEWTTPVRVDPFAVSPDAHVNILGALYDVGARATGATAWPRVTWTGETRVFASTDGSLTTQHLTHALPSIYIDAKTGVPRVPDVMLRFRDINPISAGLEIFEGAALQERLKAAAADAIPLLQFPIGAADVGRYEAVFDGTSMGAMAAYTLAPALELRRVLGYDADGVGTSILAPTADVLGAPLFAPCLTLTSDRSMPQYGAVQWDDEGVVPRSFPLIANGAVVDYFSTRATAGALASWYSKTGRPLASQGTTIAQSPSTPPRARATDLVIASGASGTTLDTLIRGVKRGVLVRSLEYVSSDQQLSGGAFFPEMLFEITRGKITRRLIDSGVQFGTKSFWKGITTMGDASTVEYGVARRYPNAGTIEYTPVRAPAAHVARLDVIQRNG